MGITSGGLSGCKLPGDEFQIADGITLFSTYAHFMETNLMAFAPAAEGRHHPEPWIALPGSSGTDIETELVIDDTNPFAKDIEPQALIWLVVSLIRVCFKPDINIPVLAKCRMHDLKAKPHDDVLAIFETRKRNFAHAEKTLTFKVLEWIRDSIGDAVTLYKDHRYRTLLEAYDYAQYNNVSSTSMIAIWGSIEQIFSANAGELRYRVSISLASYLEEVGDGRYDLFKKIQKLYDERSRAAHKNAAIRPDVLLQSFYLLSKIIVEITRLNKIPSQEDLERNILLP